VAWVGFGVAAVLSSILANPRIALASSFAFLVSQMLDVAVFNRLRRQAWWHAPRVASVIDTSIFFAQVSAAPMSHGCRWLLVISASNC